MAEFVHASLIQSPPGYELGAQLGAGGYARVYELPYAPNMVAKVMPFEEDKVNDEEYERARRDVEDEPCKPLLATYNHRGSYVEVERAVWAARAGVGPQVYLSWRSGPYLVLVMERMSEDVASYCRRTGYILPPVAFQLAKARFHALWAAGYCHEDMHLNNIMVDLDERGFILDVKLIDFGSPRLEGCAPDTTFRHLYEDMLQAARRELEVVEPAVYTGMPPGGAPFHTWSVFDKRTYDGGDEAAP